MKDKPTIDNEFNEVTVDGITFIRVRMSEGLYPHSCRHCDYLKYMKSKDVTNNCIFDCFLCCSRGYHYKYKSVVDKALGAL